jgi:NACHT domain
MLVNWSDILDGEIVNAAWAVAGMVAKPRTSRRTAALDTAAWADTERLLRDALAGIAMDSEMPDLSADEAAELAAAVRRDEVQGALRTLLACRLTDAPETDAARAREAVRLAVAAGPTSPARETSAITGDGSITLNARSAGSSQSFAQPIGGLYAVPLSEYLDERVCAFVAKLEGRVGFAGLAQVRSEAYNARIVALLGAIERQVAALADSTRRSPAETEFLERYRRQAHLRHGFLTPPDFDRRRRVPVADIYVPTRVSEDDQSERIGLTQETELASLKVWDLVERLDRTVLLGDPGGGKTTAANVLTDHFAGDAGRRVPFLVTLREYAAKAPIEWSVAEHIEHNLKTLYQSPAPDGLVERLLLTGRAVVTFDGLDELLDTTRRRDVSDRVEQFCAAYPLTPVLVTSRMVGYDQARLDDTQFDCYRLGCFGDDDVAEYARKWFTTQEGVAAAEAEAKASAFLAESGNAKDLRSNPLLLSLMCILYRGAGSLPGDRAGVYARCAELLLRKWDEQRDLYRQVKADHLVEPTIRYLAWWLFTREDSRTETTERDLRAKAAEFLFGRGYESEDEARAAAQEFIDFCRGRMWVFSEVGTTANGEKLYAFTHRTFMEYFAAGYLAATSDTPERLALALAPHIDVGEWTTVGQLAIQIKQGGTDMAADRVYATLLDQRGKHRDRFMSMAFLALCVSSSRPSPAAVRGLTRAILDDAFTAELRAGADVLRILLARSPQYEPYVGDEMSRRIGVMAASGDRDTQALGLRFVLEMAKGFRHSLWRPWVDKQVSRYRAEILDIAAYDSDFRVLAVAVDAISAAEALAMPGHLGVLLRDRELVAAYQAKLTADAEILMRALTAIGRFLAEHEQLPWVSTPLYDEPLPLITMRMSSLLEMFKDRGEFTGLGLAAAIAIGSELSDLPTFKQAYRLSELPMPARFRPLFKDWAAGRVEFAEITNGQGQSKGR